MVLSPHLVTSLGLSNPISGALSPFVNQLHEHTVEYHASKHTETLHEDEARTYIYLRAATEQALRIIGLRAASAGDKVRVDRSRITVCHAHVDASTPIIFVGRCH